jgi:DNA-binding response OmpR family regulator
MLQESSVAKRAGSRVPDLSDNRLRSLRFLLPLRGSRRPLPPPPDGANSILYCDPGNRVAKLLVSDDDPQILNLVRLILESAGHQVQATSDPRQVQQLAAAMRPDAIILDVLMPVSGFELLSELRNDTRTSGSPILFLSGLGEGSDRVRGLREGADDYLVKPFEPAELVLRVERLIAWRANQPKSPEPDDQVLRFGRYEVIDILGEGSMGTVYRGLDPRLEREVALKTIRLDAATTESRRLELLALLRNEAVTIARLSHPNIVSVYDMGDTRDSAFVAMELVDGVSLGDYLRLRGPLTVEKLIPLGAAIASGLALSHDREVVHRDIKPGNVLLGREGAVKLTDFGLAYVVSSMLEDSTELSGTPGYVPPEVLSQRAYTEPGDIFGLGATFYESLAGFHPLSGDSLRDTILNTLQGRIRPLEDSVPDMPPELGSLILDQLSVDPAKRPTAVEVAARLERLADQMGLRWSADDVPPRRSQQIGVSRSS